MRKHLFLLILFFQCYFTSATPQAPDKFIINGVKYDIIPPAVMGEYFQNNPKKRPKPPFPTNLYRGFIATYEIKNNELLIIDISIINNSNQRKELKDSRISNFNWINNLYKRSIERRSTLPQEIKADWFSGLLFIIQEYLLWPHESSNGYFTVIEIENGNYLKSFVISNEQYKKYIDARSEIITKADLFQNIYERLNDGTMPEEILGYFMKAYRN